MAVDAEFKEFRSYCKWFTLRTCHVLLGSRTGLKEVTSTTSSSSPMCPGGDKSTSCWFNLRIEPTPETVADVRKALDTRYLPDARNICVEVHLVTPEGLSLPMEVWCLGFDKDGTGLLHAGRWVSSSEVYNRLSGLLRAVLVASRVTPCYKYYSRRQGRDSFVLCFRIRHAPPQAGLLGHQGVRTVSLGWVDSEWGQISVSLQYRTHMVLDSNDDGNLGLSEGSGRSILASRIGRRGGGPILPGRAEEHFWLTEKPRDPAPRLNLKSPTSRRSDVDELKTEKLNLGDSSHLGLFPRRNSQLLGTGNNATEWKMDELCIDYASGFSPILTSPRAVLAPNVAPGTSRRTSVKTPKRRYAHHRRHFSLDDSLGSWAATDSNSSTTSLEAHSFYDTSRWSQSTHTTPRLCVEQLKGAAPSALAFGHIPITIPSAGRSASSCCASVAQPIHQETPPTSPDLARPSGGCFADDSPMPQSRRLINPERPFINELGFTSDVSHSAPNLPSGVHRITMLPHKFIDLDRYDTNRTRDVRADIDAATHASRRPGLGYASRFSEPSRLGEKLRPSEQICCRQADTAFCRSDSSSSSSSSSSEDDYVKVKLPFGCQGGLARLVRDCKLAPPSLLSFEGPAGGFENLETIPVRLVGYLKNVCLFDAFVASLKGRDEEEEDEYEHS